MFYRNEPIQIIGFSCECDDEREKFKIYYEANKAITKFNEKAKRDNIIKEQQKEIIDLKIKNLELEKKLLEGNNE